MIDAAVDPLLHNGFVPVVLKRELPQLSDTVTAGAEGIVLGAAAPLPEALVQPFTVCVTVYVAFVMTVMDELVSPVLHNKFDPLVLNRELPQLLLTVTTGAGVLTGAATPLPAALVQPFIV